MNILAIDTSTKACVLGLMKDEVCHEQTEVVDRNHSKVILPKIDGLLHEACLGKNELDLIVFGQGPGSFTGLRIGVGVVQGLAFGLDIPVAAVSSMACLAQAVFRNYQHEHALVALIARNSEVYFGSYSVVDGFVELNGSEAVIEASEIPVQDVSKSWVGIGNAWQLRTKLQSGANVDVDDIYMELYPKALDLLQLGLRRYQQGHGTTALEARPQYLREQVATPPAAPGRD